MLAAMTILHAVDYVLQNRGADAKGNDQEIRDFVKNAAAASFEFGVIRDFALAAKHCRLSSPGKKGFHSGQYMVATPAFYGRMAIGRSFFGDKVGGVTIQIADHRYVNLTKALQGAMKFLEQEFPDLRSPSANVDEGTRPGP